MGSISDESIRRRKGWQDGNAAFLLDNFGYLFSLSKPIFQLEKSSLANVDN